MPFSSVPAAGLFGPIEETPATHDLLEALRAGDVTGAVQVISRHWEELWWAMPPTLVGEIVACLPAESMVGTPALRAWAMLSGSQAVVSARHRPEGDASDEEVAEALLLEAIALRLAGRPVDALAVLENSPESYSVFGHLREDTTGGRLPSRRLSIGLIALLAERHAMARQQLGAAARTRSPVRFPG